MLRTLCLLSLLGAVTVSSGCGGPNCTSGTLSVELTFDTAAAQADTIRVITTVDGASASVDTPYTSGQTTFRAQFPDVAYKTGLSVDVAVEARQGDAVLAAASQSGYLLPATCAVLPLTLSDAGTLFTISGTVVGIEGTGLVLENGSDDLSLLADGSFMFDMPVASGANYDVKVKTQPTSPTQNCTVDDGSGTIDDMDITDVSVTCETSSFTVSGTITGLTMDGLALEDNGNDVLTASEATTMFTFAMSVPSGGSYDVEVLDQPNMQSCTVTNGKGVITDANITNVVIACQ